ncbi:alpha-fucosidase A [Sclerotinia borealis F-4128]|uniref:Alpha-fucosidase A n=1 Tax=Sclerotinia borealis (strain F-4128) TaxID=1432307 RepID=W9CIJ8_SCLBF|nr:alpha-fucosidase A [Sclerotinia borealis F-4128]
MNENSVWYGGPQDRTPKDAFKNLERLRHFIRRGDHAEAEKLVEQAFFATPHSQRHYEPLGTLTLELKHDPAEVKNYWRGLDLSAATVTTKYEYLGIKYKRRAFASYPDDVLVIQWEALEKTEFTLRLSRYSDREYTTDEFVDSIEALDGNIVMRGTPGGGNSNSLCCVVSFRDLVGDGAIKTVGNCVIVNSSKAIIVVSAQTTFRHADLEATTLSQAIDALYGHTDLLNRHIQAYNSLYGRFKLRLLPDAAHIPTNERLAVTPDPGLIALYANYGRYLLISCSRPGHKALPAILQGLWNPSFQPAWGSKYTISINTQMNYWPANVCNLKECEDPLFDLLARMANRGEKTARVMCGCRGWKSHSCTDIWADTVPQDRWMPGTSKFFQNP